MAFEIESKECVVASPNLDKGYEIQKANSYCDGMSQGLMAEDDLAKDMGIFYTFDKDTKTFLKTNQHQIIGGVMRRRGSFDETETLQLKNVKPVVQYNPSKFLTRFNT